MVDTLSGRLHRQRAKRTQILPVDRLVARFAVDKVANVAILTNQQILRLHLLDGVGVVSLQQIAVGV